MAMAGSAALVSLKAIIWAVTVVPILAPRMTLTACWIFMSPAPTKLISITVVAEEDWMAAVMRKPVNRAKNRFEVVVARMLRMRSPASFIRASLITFMPYRKRPSEPNKVRMSVIPKSNSSPMN